MMKPTRLRLLLVVVTVLAAQGALIYAYLRSGVPPASPRQRVPESRARNLDGGVPIQRKRIDDFIADVASYDFDQCSEALHDPTSKHWLLIQAVGMQSQAPSPSLQLAQDLADRRVAKLYVHVKDMHPDEAARRVASLVDEKLSIHKSNWLRTMRVARKIEQGEPQPIPADPNDLPRRFWSTDHNLHALSAALFLCAEFCEPTVVIENIDRWYGAIEPVVLEINTDPELKLLKDNAWFSSLPEKLFLLNVYAITYERHGCGPVDRLLESVGKLESRADPDFLQVPFFAWDAHTNQFDFTHLHRGVPVDDSKILTHVWMAPRWGIAISANEQRQDEILAAARKLVEECARQDK